MSEEVEIQLSKIEPDANNDIRNDYGDLTELTESMLETKGNTVPTRVYSSEGKYKLFVGYRRLKVATALNLETLKCIVDDESNEYERFLFTYHENMGRFNLHWSERAKALEIKKSLEKKFLKKTKFVETEAKEQKVSPRTVNRFLESAKIIKEFPQLTKEKSRNIAVSKYQQLKQLDDETQEKVKQNEVSIGKVLKEQKVAPSSNNINADKTVIKELKEEVKHYKKQAESKQETIKEDNQETIKEDNQETKESKNLIEEVKQLEKEERIEGGVWLISEVKDMVESATTCQGFGNKEEMEEKECKECEKEDKQVFDRCQFWFDNYNEK